MSAIRALLALVLVAAAAAPVAAAERTAATRAGAARTTAARASAPPAGQSYWMAASDGGVFAFGDGEFHGSTGALVLNRPVVAMAASPIGGGYWLAASDGGVFAFGDAGFHGSTAGLRLNAPIVAMASTPSGEGYWMVASDGGVFAFGDAGFHGSTGGIRLNAPIVGILPTLTGQGYWLAASDGGIFAFGDAGFLGSTGGTRLNSPIVGIAAAGGHGYWLAASDGGVFAFGAGFHGSTGGISLNRPIVSVAPTPTGQGYWLAASDGGVFAFGDARFHGSTGGIRLARPVVAIASEVDRRPYEVWAIDQSGTAGTLHVYDGQQLTLGVTGSATAPEVVDLSGATAAMCTAQTGAAPVRAHMLAFSADGALAIIAYVASGHVVFMDAESRTPVTCLRASAGDGGARQAHAAFPDPGGAHVLVANQNGKLLERIDTDADGDGVPYENAADIALDPAATLNLATCTTPNGAPCQDATLRPDNAPICPVMDSTGTLAFVTLRGGGMLVVDPTETPMTIVAEYDRATVHPNGCGGVEAGGWMFVNSGGGTPANPFELDVYAFPLSGFPATGSNPPGTPAPKVVVSRDAENADGHGMALPWTGRYLWVVNRSGSAIEVIDTEDASWLLSFPAVAAAPDLIVPSPGGVFLFASLRGPCPLTANAPGFNNAVGGTPGVAVYTMSAGGAGGFLRTFAPITAPAPAAFDCPTRTDDAPGSITDAADVHGLGVRLRQAA